MNAMDRYNECHECGTWFEPEADGDPHYCSTECSQ